MNFDLFVQLSPPVQIHLITAVIAFALGLVIFLLPKGTSWHKTFGWIWVGLMLLVAISSIFIRLIIQGEDTFYEGFSSIHIFTIVTLASLPLALAHIRTGNVQGHRGAMIGLYIGALLIAGAFTFLPGRVMHQMVFGG